MEAMQPEKRPGACIACGNCKAACPQEIDVPEAMRLFAEIVKGLPTWSEISRKRAESSRLDR